jgi:endonuclease III
MTMNKLEIVDRIDEMVKPLNPPVDAFESQIVRSPFRILISVLLSSRTKDAVTHKASEQLFDAADSPEKMSLLDESRIAELIFPVGFYRQKAKNIKKIAVFLSNEAHENGSIPNTFEGLTALPGVGRKTANLVLALAFKKPCIAVDIHVFRISQRLGWAKGKKPEEIEEQLKTVFPMEYWNRLNHTLVGFGQTLCKPVNPMCHRCDITGYCLYFKENKKENRKGGV